MKKLLLGLTLILLMMTAAAPNAVAGDYSMYYAVSICIDCITDIYPGSKIEKDCIVRDMGDIWLVVWNMHCPFILADPTTGPRRTGAACEVSKNTGKITYLAVSARELIK